MNNKDPENLVHKMQEKWANIILEIGKAYKKKISSNSLIFELLHDVYAFDHSEVLFKPTLAKQNQFRSSKEEFISYFLGQNKVCKEDSGFAIKGWKHVFSDAKAVFLDENMALWMGWVTLVNKDRQSTKVDKSFGFKLCKRRHLKIVLHHSSLPYQNQI